MLPTDTLDRLDTALAEFELGEDDVTLALTELIEHSAAQIGRMSREGLDFSIRGVVSIYNGMPVLHIFSFGQGGYRQVDLEDVGLVLVTAKGVIVEPTRDTPHAYGTAFPLPIEGMLELLTGAIVTRRAVPSNPN